MFGRQTMFDGVWSPNISRVCINFIFVYSLQLTREQLKSDSEAAATHTFSACETWFDGFENSLFPKRTEPIEHDKKEKGGGGGGTSCYLSETKVSL